MRFCHLFVFALLQFTTGLLQRNENYVLRMGLDDLSCIEHGRLFVHDNMSLFQCMALCSNVSSCWYLSYIRNIGRCVGFDSKATLAFVNGSRVYMKGKYVVNLERCPVNAFQIISGFYVYAVQAL